MTTTTKQKRKRINVKIVEYCFTTDDIIVTPIKMRIYKPKLDLFKEIGKCINQNN